MSLELAKIFRTTVNDALEEKRKEHWENCASLLIAWLMNEARKIPSADLPQKITQFSKEIRHMCYSMRVEMRETDFDKGAFVVKVNGSAEQTYRKLRLGTNWFEPCADLETIIMAGLDDQFGS